MKDVIQICEPGGRILDPFAGAGTTILAAVEEGYETVGIEVTDAYYKLGSDRVKFALEAKEKRREREIARASTWMSNFVSEEEKCIHLDAGKG